MQVGLVSPAHHDSLVELLCELHAYYNEGASMQPDMVRSYLQDDLLAPDSGLRLVVAADGNHRVCGFAAIFLTWSLVEFARAKRRQCWLKELYVRDSHRGRGVGGALMSWVARYAVDHDCSRIDWPVKASNARGIAFYERLGAQAVEDRRSYRLTGPHMMALARRDA